jgi:hypothetical protein
MAELAGRSPKGGDDLSFAARLASGHGKTHFSLGLKMLGLEQQRLPGEPGTACQRRLAIV